MVAGKRVAGRVPCLDGVFCTCVFAEGELVL